jgi:membrane dipeptidase
MTDSMLFRCSLGLTLWLAAIGRAEDSAPKPAAGKRGLVTVSPAARQLHNESLVCDGHNDLPWEIRKLVVNGFDAADVSRPQKRFHTDIPRLRQGNVGWQFWSAYVPTDLSEKHAAARTTLEQIDLIHRMVKRYPEAFEFADTADDVERIRKAGKIASMIGVEGGHCIEDSLPMLRIYRRLGVRYMTLTHSDNTAWADSATDKPKNNGLSPFGEEVVREMNRIGMLVDLSHVSPATMKHALRITTAPAIFSHSSARAVCDHPRNVPDDVLKLLPANGGVVMVNFFSGFVVPEAARQTKNMLEVYRELRKRYPNDRDLAAATEQYRKEHPYPRGSVHDVVDHIDRIVRMAGVDHVGLGSDFDGISTTPVQLEDVSTYPVITQVLMDRGYAPTDVKKILGGNILRAFRQAEAVARGRTN